METRAGVPVRYIPDDNIWGVLTYPTLGHIMTRVGVLDFTEEIKGSEHMHLLFSAS